MVAHNPGQDDSHALDSSDRSPLYPRRHAELIREQGKFRLISSLGIDADASLNVAIWTGSFESKLQAADKNYFTLYRFSEGSIHREDSKSQPRKAGAISLRPPGSSSVHSSIGKVVFTQVSLSRSLFGELLEERHSHLLPTLLSIEKDDCHGSQFRELFNRIISMKGHSPFRMRTLLDAYAVTLAEQIVCSEFDNNTLQNKKPYRLGKVVLNDIEEYIRSSLAQDLSLAALARFAGMSSSHFLRSFKRTTGKSPHQAILDARIDAACELLRVGQLPMSEIALLVGFSSPSHFSSVFGKRMGCSPLAYRKYRT